VEDVIKDFLVESVENLDKLDQALVALEKDPGNRTTLAGIFRTIHTIKGTCGFLGFGRLEGLTHVGETLLGKLRDGALNLTAERTSALLALSDAVRAMLGHIEANGSEAQVDYSTLIATLNQLLENTASAVSTAAARPPTPTAPPEKVAEKAPEPASAKPADKPAAADLQPPANAPAPSAPLPATAAAPDHPPEPNSEGDPADAKPKASAAETKQAARVDSTVRVDVDLLDSLMNQVGELVLARNQILQYASNLDDPTFLTTTQRLNLITTELQEGVMKTRMQPIGSIWAKLPRVVRDIATICNKRARLEMEGEETELDRTIIEAIKDPLTHIVRNSVDHGIEAPNDRVAAGKPDEGCIRLRAFHEGGQVVVEIHDDGGGIDVRRVKEKAIRSNLLTPEQAARMSEREACHLIFLPGLSTAKQVTSISGRGVGMDVVKTNVERIGGTVDVQTELGRGTVLRIKIPLTLAIIPALVVTSAGDNFAIPQVSLLELVRLEGENATRAVELVHDVPVYRLRGQLLSLVWLSEVLQVGRRDEATKKGAHPVLNIAVLQAEQHRFGLVVDDVNDNQEIVVKPLGKLLKSLSCYAGATIMGDGRVALILDALGIAQTAGVRHETHDTTGKAPAGNSTGEGAGDTQSLLLFAVGGNDRMAVPLDEVARLEEFAKDRIEPTGSGHVVQYRGDIMPLVDLAAVLGRPGDAHWHERESCQVIVRGNDAGHVGLVVDRILDVVEQRVRITRRVHTPGLLGTTVVNGRVTELLDIANAVALAGLEITPHA
jgi:two-component system chemotaxis sensor kinase CheA